MGKPLICTQHKKKLCVGLAQFRLKHFTSFCTVISLLVKKHLRAGVKFYIQEYVNILEICIVGENTGHLSI